MSSLFNREKLIEFVKENDPNNPFTLDNLLKKMTKEVIETLFEAEIEAILGYEKNKRKNRSSKSSKPEKIEEFEELEEESYKPYENSSSNSNRRNGYIEKTVNSKFGKIRLKRPRDREGIYQPIVVKNRQKDIGGIQEKVLSLFAHGMSIRDIRNS